VPGYFRWMRFVTSAVGATLTVLILSGCVQQPSPPIPSSTPTNTPVFATAADALAAARTAYRDYLAVSAVVAGDGGKHPERIGSVVGPAWLPTELSGFKDLARKKLRLVGVSTFSVFSLQDREDEPNGLAVVHVYVCEDVGPTRVLNSAGHDVTPSARKPLHPLVVKFVSQANRPTRLLYAGGDPWAGKDFC
jgi:hypothetical protein